MDQNLRRSRHSVTEWNTLARCARKYSWGSLGRAPAPVALERLIKTALGEDDAESAQLGTEVHRALARGDLVEVRRLGHGPLADWLAARPPADRVWNELTFEIAMGPEIFVGAMDRVEERGGRFTLIDYKVLSRPKSDDALLEIYELPMQLYAYALAELEPRARNRACAVLVASTTEGVREVEVRLPDFSELFGLAHEWCQRADAIVRGQTEAIPTPGAHCGNCEFSVHCAEAEAQLQST